MTPSLLRRIGQGLTALSAVAIAYATLIPQVTAPVEADDRLWHFLLFLPMGAGGALWMSALPLNVQKRAGAFVLLLVVAFAAATELIQIPMETRSASFDDFIADAAGAGVGVLLGGAIALFVNRRTSHG